MLILFGLCCQFPLVMLSLEIYVLSNPMPFKGKVSSKSLALLGELEHKMGSRHPMVRLCIGRSQQKERMVIEGALIQLHRKWKLLFQVLYLQDLLQPTSYM